MNLLDDGSPVESLADDIRDDADGEVLPLLSLLIFGFERDMMSVTCR